MKRVQKQIVSFFAIFVLIIGFALLVGPQSVRAASSDGICDSTSEANTPDCDGFCSKAGDKAPDCDGFCERGDNTTPSPADCDGTTCDEGDAQGSLDCNGICAGEDAECSVDCDPLGKCAFERETVLGKSDARTIVARVINVALGVLGTIAVVIVLWGGLKWMTAGGSDDKIGEARKLMAAGVVGLAIILAAYSIANFAIKGLTQAVQQ